MSNESENKRIDMTQFEGATEGPWYAEEEEVEEGKAWTVRGGDHWVVMESDGCLRIDWKKEDALLTAAAPDLIAELKKTYKVIELLQGHYEDSERHAAFHKEGVCDFLMFDCQYCASE